MSDRDGSGILWFLAGLGVGAAAGMLLAPQAGEETREALLAKAEEGREFVKERARQAREQASDLVDRGKSIVNEQKEQVRSAYKAGVQKYQEATTADRETASGV